MDRYPQQDQLFDCLAHRHRREIIDVLRNTESPTSTFELAKDVAESVHRASITEIPSFESVRQSLYHVHLPKLEKAGLVECDVERDTVAPTEFTSHSGVIVDAMDLIVEDGRRISVGARNWDDEQVMG